MAPQCFPAFSSLSPCWLSCYGRPFGTAHRRPRTGSVSIRSGTASREGALRRLGTIALFVAAILPSYADVGVVIMVVAGAAATTVVVAHEVDRRLGRQPHSVQPTLEYCAALVAGAAVVLPYTMAFLRYAPARYGSAAGGGFSQPRWASPAEMAGVWDMYKVPTHTLFPTGRSTATALLLVSALIVSACVVSLRALSRIERTVVLVGVALIASVFLRSRYLQAASNYQYFKMYTYMLPILLVLLFAGTVGKPAPRVAGRTIRGPMALAVAITLATGVSYVVRFDKQARHVSEKVMALASDPTARAALSDVALVLTNPSDVNAKMGTYMAAAVVPINWANRRPDTAVAASPELKLAVGFVEGDADACLACIRDKYAADVLLDRPGLVLLSTGLRLGDVTDAEGMFSAARLHLGLLANSKNAIAELFPVDKTASPEHHARASLSRTHLSFRAVV